MVEVSVFRHDNGWGMTYQFGYPGRPSFREGILLSESLDGLMNVIMIIHRSALSLSVFTNEFDKLRFEGFCENLGVRVDNPRLVNRQEEDEFSGCLEEKTLPGKYGYR